MTLKNADCFESHGRKLFVFGQDETCFHVLSFEVGIRGRGEKRRLWTQKLIVSRREVLACVGELISCFRVEVRDVSESRRLRVRMDSHRLEEGAMVEFHYV